MLAKPRASVLSDRQSELLFPQAGSAVLGGVSVRVEPTAAGAFRRLEHVAALRILTGSSGWTNEAPPGIKVQSLGNIQ